MSIAETYPVYEIDRPAQVSFQPVSFGDFREQYPVMRPVVIDGICREGETVNVIASSKVGKSWLSMDMAMSVAIGGRWLDTYQTSQGRVLLVDNELHAETLASRLERIRDARQYDAGDLEALEVISLRGRLTDLHRLGSWFDSLEPDTYKLIVLDALYRLIPSGANENDNAGMMMLYNALDGHAARLGCSFVVIHHSSKGDQGGKSVTDVGSGAGSMSRAVDTHLVIRPHEKETYAVLDGAPRSFPPMEPQTVYFEYPLWHPSALEPKVATRTTAAQRAHADKDRASLDQLATQYADSPFTAYDVRKVVGCGQQRADRLVAVGLAEGLFEKSGTTTNQRKQETDQYRVTRTETRLETRTDKQVSYEWHP